MTVRPATDDDLASWAGTGTAVRESAQPATSCIGISTTHTRRMPAAM